MALVGRGGVRTAVIQVAGRPGEELKGGGHAGVASSDDARRH